MPDNNETRAVVGGGGIGALSIRVLLFMSSKRSLPNLHGNST